MAFFIVIRGDNGLDIDLYRSNDIAEMFMIAHILEIPPIKP
jgi:hypothetical protein